MPTATLDPPTTTPQAPPAPAQAARVTCSTKQLKRAVTIARSFTPARATTMPVLSCLLLDAAGGKLVVTGYDLEVGGRVVLDAQASEPARLCVHAATLAEIVDSLSADGELVLTFAERQRLRVESGQSQFTLDGLDPEQFPRLPEPQTRSDAHLVLPAPLLRAVVASTAFACSDDDSRPQLTGLLLRVAGGAVRAVGTDTHRLAIRDAPNVEATGEASVIVPERALSALARGLGDSTADVEVSIEPANVRFESGDLSIVSRLISGPFPQYERVLPTSFNATLTAPREALLRAVRRAAIVARLDKRNHLTLTAAGDGVLHLTAESQGAGKAAEEVSCRLDGADETVVAFNCNYLVDVLGVLASDDVTMALTGAVTPALVTGVGAEDAGWQCVLMPLQQKG